MVKAIGAVELFARRRTDGNTAYATLYARSKQLIHAECAWLTNHYGIEVSTDIDDGLEFSFMFGLFCLWVHLAFIRCKTEREWGIKFHHGAAWFALGQDKWNGRPMAFYPLDFLFGRQKYTKTVTGTHEVLIPMPEKSYPATCTTDTSTWVRPRWPFWPLTITRHSAWIDIPGGVPMPSRKWRDDGLFGTGASSRPGESMVTPEKAIGNVVASVLESRRKYGKGYHDTGAREAV